MNKYAKKLDALSEGRFTGSASYDNTPSPVLVAMAEMAYATSLGKGENRNGVATPALSRLVEEPQKSTNTIDAAKLLKQSSRDL